MAELECFPMVHGGYPDQVNTIGGWLVTSWPGGRIDPIRGGYGNHGGIDLVRNGGTHGAPFYSVVSGRVSQGWDPGGGGNWTSLFGDNGDYYGYGHALSFAPGVSGTHVPAGTLLGYIDSTGGSTGSHMHFAVRFAGASRYGDPTDVLRDAASRGAYPGATPAPEPDQPDDQNEDEMSAEQVQEIKDHIDARLEQVATADRAHMAAIADQRAAVVIEAVVRAIDVAATEEEVTRKRDELLAVVLPRLGEIDAELAKLKD